MSLKDALTTIKKQFGDEAAYIVGDGESLKMDAISTGFPSLDAALRVGGFPRGRIVEIIGIESGGKSTLAMTIIAAAQKAGGSGALVDAEHSFDPEYARALGMNVDDLIISQPDWGEQALEITDALVQSGELSVIVVDSVAALVPKAEVEGDMGQIQMGLQARMMSQALRKLTASVSKNKVLLIFINQIRMKIGIAYGNPETTPGGNALKFYSSVRLDVRRKDIIKTGEDEPVGALTRIRVIKNKCGAPFGEATLQLIYGEGFSREFDLLTMAVEKGVVDKSGSWYSYGGEKLGQGTENVRLFLKENPETFNKIYEATK